MTIEEIIAWKNFPNILEKARNKANRRYPSILEIDDDAEFGEYDINEAKRDIFIEGYLEAERDLEAEKDIIIERAVTWLKDNANKYIVDLTETYPDAPVNIIVGGMCWEDLTKYLKDNEQH